MEIIAFLTVAGIIIGILVIIGLLQIAIMAPRWANNIFSELKKHTKELEEIKKAQTSPVREEKSKEYFG